MNTTDTSGRVRRSRFLPWLVALAALGVAVVFVPYPGRGVVLCTLMYAECQPWRTIPEMPGWNVPTDPQEKAAYDYAHSLPTPEAAPKPVPFDFRAARIAWLEGGKSVEQQYFEHLCATEDSETIVRRVTEVDGFQLMRPRGRTIDTPEDSDRYGPEDPVGFGWFSDSNQFRDKPIDWLGDAYVQPLYGVYTYVEYVDMNDPTRIVRVERMPASEALRWTTGNWRPGLRVPEVVVRTNDTAIRSRYAYTRRGLRRPRDRDLGIAGGEYLIVDRTTNEVLAVRRTFKSTYNPRKPGLTNWSGARECKRDEHPTPYFVAKVIAPVLTVNDEFLPASQRQAYHEHLQSLIANRRAYVRP